MTESNSFISPLWHHLSLDVFIEEAEEEQRDFVFPVGRSLGAGVFLVRNTQDSRAALIEWWGLIAAGYI